MFLVAAIHPFSLFADFTDGPILMTKKTEGKSEMFFRRSLTPFFLSRNWTRSLYFGFRNMDNILMKNWGEKNENKCCFFSVFKTQWLCIPQEFLVLSEWLLSSMPCVHNQL